MRPQRAARFAGQFYPAGADACRAAVDRFLAGDAPAPALGGLVPHAGWRYSGATAGLTMRAVAEAKPDVVVVFGAVHVLDRNHASLWDQGEWQTPLGPMQIDEALTTAVARCRRIETDLAAHRDEHSIEVEIPLLRRALPESHLVPIMVRPGPYAAEIGRFVGRAAADSGRRTAFLASTDLTHYGPMFGFEPAGHGEPGIRWARDVNDRRFIARVAALDIEAVIPEAAAHRNACGAGAVAAALAAVQEFGGAAYRELRHTTSAEVEPDDERENSVGYEAGIFLPHTAVSRETT